MSARSLSYSESVASFFSCFYTLLYSLLFSYSFTSAYPQNIPQFTWAVPQYSIGRTLFNVPQHQKNLVEWDNLTSTLQRNSVTTPPPWQIIAVDGTQTALSCALGWAQPLQHINECGILAGTSPTVLFWDTERLTSPPQWSTLWDVVRCPGRRAFFKGARTTLETALLADGIPPNMIYSILSTSEGVEHAFHKLDQLRPYIKWWETPQEAHTLLIRKEVLMGTTPLSVLSFTHNNPINLPYTSQNNSTLYNVMYWQIPSTVNQKTTHSLIQKLHTSFPTFLSEPSPLPKESLEISDIFWATHTFTLESRFNNWLHHSDTPTSRSQAP